ncbi:MAG TPA: hypothetical protein VF407_17990, partial [Polyangiaceae bacterium]
MRVFPSFVAVASFLALGALALPVRADDGEKRDLVREQHYEDRLGAIDPSLVPTFHTATTALDGRDLPTAKTGFATVIAKAPTFDPALRRLCVVESLLGENASAITHCRAAVAVERSPENESALATALISQKMPSSAQEHEAMSLAREAALAKPDEAYLQATLCEVAIREQDAATADGCSTKLLAIQPNQYVSHLYRAFALGMTGNLTGGEKELDRAH